MSGRISQELRRRLDNLETKLRDRRGLERVLFADGIMGYIALIVVATIFAVELTANATRGEGWVSVAHFVVVGTLEATIISYLFWVVGRRSWLRLRAYRVRRRLAHVD